MQPRPTAAELLAAVADVLEHEVVPALDGPAQHHARVAANLVAIVERELRLAPANADREEAIIAALLGDPEPIDAETDRDVGSTEHLQAQRARLAAALRAGMADDPARVAAVWAALMAVAGDDLAISKPGHDRWRGR